MAITLYAIVYMGTGSCILLSWSHNNVFFSVSACVYLCVCVCVCLCVCTCSGEPGHHNLCFPDSMERYSSSSSCV